jgi:hypothetical protein
MGSTTDRPNGIDPAVFSPDAVDPETGAFKEQPVKALSAFSASAHPGPGNPVDRHKRWVSASTLTFRRRKA